MGTTKLTTPVRETAERPTSWRTWRWTLGNYFFITPFMLLFLLFIVGPILFSFYMSLHDWKILATDHPFIGFQNYSNLMVDDIWWKSLRNSTFFAFLTAGFNTVFALIVAIAVNQPIRGRDFYRFIFYAPVILSVSAMSIIMVWMMNTQYGLINFLLVWLGLPAVRWLGDASLVIPSLSLATVWWTFGFPMLIYLAGLQNIPDHLYEAARIDGAGSLETVRHITIPLVAPYTLFVGITQLIAHFQVFGQPYIMTNGGPGRSSFTVIMYLHQTAWRYYRMGYGAALAIGLAVVIFAFTLVQFRLFGERSKVEY